MVQEKYGNGIKRKEEPVAPFDRLLDILETMDVAEARKGNVRWLMKNLGNKNSNHSDFHEAMELLKKLNFVKPKQEVSSEA